jgi:cysteinyl-tRNA synthetase
MVAMIAALIARGHAYEAEGHVLFSVASYPDYGKFAHRSLDEMQAGARVEVAPYKRDPMDFVLWKPSDAATPGWDSPWGRGRPGWHIECSAMSEALLGTSFDIHGGGIDLMFPHHENEIAQSTCAHGGKVFARYWLHNGMLTFDGRKMSKSLGNVLVLHELLQLHPAEVLRFLLLKAHYRQPLDWSDGTLAQARATLDGWYTVLRDLDDVEVGAQEREVPAELEAALCDDLNTPEAFAVVARLAGAARAAGTPEAKRNAKAALLGAADMLGILQHEPEAWFKQSTGGAAVDEAEVQRLVEARAAAKKARAFAEADRIRDQLAAMGIAIEDTPQGPRWKVVGTDGCIA